MDEETEEVIGPITDFHVITTMSSELPLRSRAASNFGRGSTYTVPQCPRLSVLPFAWNGQA